MNRHHQLALSAAAGVVVAAWSAHLSPLLLKHWDEFQLAYAVTDWDLTRHHPHPPGYYLFVSLGRLLTPIAGAPERALQLVSAGALGAASATIVAAIPRDVPTRDTLVVTAAVVAFAMQSALLRLFSTVGLTYCLEAAAWLVIALWVGRHPNAASLRRLSFFTGLSAGIRPTILPWFVALVATERLLSKPADPWPRLSARGALQCAASLALGLAFWVVPLLFESGGLLSYLQATASTLSQNIWAKSLWETGLSGLAERWQLVNYLWLGGGMLLVAVPPLLFLAGKTPSTRALGAATLIPMGFYAFLMHDTPGYMVTPTITVLAWLSLKVCALPGRIRLSGAVAVLALAITFPLTPGLASVLGEDPYTRHSKRDERLANIFATVREHAPQGASLLVTSREYWGYGLRHVAHYLPEYPVLQLETDPHMRIVQKERPYLIARGSNLEAVGPDPLNLPGVLGGGLKLVVYMVPLRARDYTQFVDASCNPYAKALKVPGGDELAVISVEQVGGRVAARSGRLVCSLSDPL